MYLWISKDNEYHENLNVQPGRGVNVHMFMKISTDNKCGNVHMYMRISKDNECL